MTSNKDLNIVTSNKDLNIVTSNEDRRVELARRVDDTMKTRTYHKKDKKCSVCDKPFEGTAKANVCGPTCRKRKSRSA